MSRLGKIIFLLIVQVALIVFACVMIILKYGGFYEGILWGLIFGISIATIPETYEMYRKNKRRH